MLKRKLPVVALAVSIIAFIYYYAAIANSGNPDKTYSSITQSDADTSFNYLYASVHVNDSTPYYQYKKIADSFGQLQTMRRLENRSVSHGGFVYGYFGVSKIRRYKNLRTYNDHDSSFRYYISLGGYTLPPHNFFFIQNETYNLGYVVWDSVKKMEPGPVHMGHQARKQIPVRYAEEDKRMLIPVSKAQFEFYSLLLRASYLAFLAIIVFLFLGLPLQVLINISKGKAFDLKNIRYLNWAGTGFLVYAVLDFFLPYVVGWCFGETIPPDFKREPVLRNVLSQIWPLFGAAAFFGIAKAFKRGYKLQQEQDLTI